MKKIIKSTVFIPDPRKLADDVNDLLMVMHSTTGIDLLRVRTEIMSHSRLLHAAYAVDEVVLASTNDMHALLDHINVRLERELAAGVAQELKITTTEEDEL